MKTKEEIEYWLGKVKKIDGIIEEIEAEFDDVKDLGQFKEWLEWMLKK